MDDPRPKTILLDIDGVILRQYGGLDEQMLRDPKILPGVTKRLHEWDCLGYNLILCTGRRESMRKRTEEQLAACGIYYDQLVMGLGGGVRVLINNDKSSFPGLETAVGITIPKNEGLDNVKI
jgi:hypothetical protein